jgi:hypothetical protein
MKARAHSLSGERTAIGTSQDATFGPGCMDQTLAELAEQIVEMQVFRSRASARSWIGS